ADEADARMDCPEDPPRRYRRPVDLAHHRRPYPTPPRPPPRRGPPPALGTPHRTPSPHPSPRPPRASQPARHDRETGDRTDTHTTRPWTASRLEEQAPSQASRRREDGQTRRVDQGTSSSPTLNVKLR